MPLLADLHDKGRTVLARGKGLSYSDCCTNNDDNLIETSRLNHLLAFDESTATVHCQGGATFADLFLAHPDYIPPVLPGTVHASIAGGIANDIHGKNNVSAGTIGKHIVSLELQAGRHAFHCSLTENPDLFQATIAGLGLTGVIKRIAIRLKKTSPYVMVQSEKHTQMASLLHRMQNEGLQHTHQVAWLDLLNQPRALLHFANPCDDHVAKKSTHLSIPPLPCRLITGWGMRLFNSCYFQGASTQARIQSLRDFNNPLDSIKNWTRAYGKYGLLQFQAVFDAGSALPIIEDLLRIIRRHAATPTLAVLKYFHQPGAGLLSFVQPGFSLAIDFMNNERARQAITNMNALISEAHGKIYLAKDLFLTQEQFARQYPQQDRFRRLLQQYDCGMQSDLGKRLGLVL